MTLKIVTLQKILVSILYKKTTIRTFSLTSENHPESPVSSCFGAVRTHTIASEGKFALMLWRASWQSGNTSARSPLLLLL